jgi:hypothetical protein
MRYSKIIVGGSAVLGGFLVGTMAAVGGPVPLPEFSMFQAIQRIPNLKTDVVYRNAGQAKKPLAKLPADPDAALKEVAARYGKTIIRVQDVAVLADAVQTGVPGSKSLSSARNAMEAQYGGGAALDAYVEGVASAAKSLAATLPPNAHTFAGLNPAQQASAMRCFRAQLLATRAGSMETLLSPEGAGPGG